MPKDHKKRGRRAEDKKRKHKSDDQAEAEGESKRRRQSHHDDDNDDDVHMEEAPIYEGENSQQQNGEGLAYPNPDETPFFGMLDEEEQEYFRRADDMLELNEFADEEDRSNFLASVYKEAEGKELKMANSQSCSRLMERLIQLSTPLQLKNLFQKFSGNFLHLVQHRFASHCCEALFIQSAPTVTVEVHAPIERENPDDPDEVMVSMEDLYLHAIRELDGYLGFLMTDRFASHTLRVLLVVLSGQALAPSGTNSVLRSKKKEHVSVTGAEKKSQLSLEERTVPESFIQAMEKIISESVSGLDATYLRALATHQTGNPTLQLLLQLELTKFGKQRAKDEKSIIHKLLPDDPIAEGTESLSFINGMVYDPVGSRLLETIIEHAPGKMFKSIYRQAFKDRIETLARNDTASYVVSKLLCRLGKDDLSEATEKLSSTMSTLAKHNRTALIKTLIERCAVREVGTASLAAALEVAYGGPKGFEITQLLKSNTAGINPAVATSKNNNQADKLHSSLLAQAMIAVPGPLSTLVLDSLARLGPPLALSIARDSSSSHTLQAALTLPAASPIFRRKMIQKFYGHVAEMALDPSASHVIDAVWTGTSGLAFIRERIAEELAEAEASLRESHVGRAVWRNWKMDLYKRRRKDWVLESRQNAGSDGFMSFPEPIGNGEEKNGIYGGSAKVARHMSAIEKARMRHAQEKAAKEKNENAKKEKN